MNESHVPRCLVIGNTSVIGEAIIARMSGTWDVKTAGRHDADVKIDLSHPLADVELTQQFDCAVLVAADFGGESPDDYVRAELVNTAGALAACRLAEAAGVAHFILISTASANYSDGDPYFGIYSLSKRHGEEVTKLYCSRRNLDLTILRLTGVYDAAGRSRRHQPLLYALIDRARSGADITINGSADPSRNFIFVSDVARVVERVASARLVGSFGCPGPSSMPISEIAAAVLDVFGRGGQVRFDPSRPDIPTLATVADPNPYDQLSCWPEIDLAQGLRLIANSLEASSPS